MSPSPAAASPPVIAIAAGHTCLREFGGHPYRITVWTDAEWARLPEGRRPGNAQPIAGLGWLDATPAEGPGG